MPCPGRVGRRRLATAARGRGDRGSPVGCCPSRLLGGKTNGTATRRSSACVYGSSSGGHVAQLLGLRPRDARYRSSTPSVMTAAPDPRAA